MRDLLEEFDITHDEINRLTDRLSHVRFGGNLYQKTLIEIERLQKRLKFIEALALNSKEEP